MCNFSGRLRVKVVPQAPCGTAFFHSFLTSPLPGYAEVPVKCGAAASAHRLPWATLAAQPVTAGIGMCQCERAVWVYVCLRVLTALRALPRTPSESNKAYGAMIEREADGGSADPVNASPTKLGFQEDQRRAYDRAQRPSGDARRLPALAPRLHTLSLELTARSLPRQQDGSPETGTDSTDWRWI